MPNGPLLLAVGAESIWPEAAAPALALASGVLAVVLFAFGCAQGPLIRARFQSDDPGAVVLDEIVGYLIALALFAAVVGLPDPTAVVVLFAAFRVFDIAKPPPIRRLEELHGALGVMADDALAGVYAGAVAILVRQFLLA